MDHLPAQHPELGNGMISPAEVVERFLVEGVRTDAVAKVEQGRRPGRTQHADSGTRLDVVARPSVAVGEDHPPVFVGVVRQVGDLAGG